MSRIALSGSFRPVVDGIRPSKVPPHDEISVTVVLEDDVKDEQFNALDHFCSSNKLTLGRLLSNTPEIYKLSGSPSAFEVAFETKLDVVEHPDLGVFRQAWHPPTVPVELDGVFHAVIGLDDRPVARPHYQYHPGQYVGDHDGEKMVKELAPLASAPAGSFTPPQLAQLYDFPVSTGFGVLVGIIELGGAINQNDVNAAMKSYGVTQTNRPVVVPVDGAKPKSDGANGADGEVALDVQIVASIAPEATLRVYFAPNTDAGFLDALVQSLAETDITSISWGGPEDSWTAGARSSFEKVMQASGKPVFVASGDQGSSDGVAGTKSHVDFPASSPSAIGCGGTYLVSTGGAFSSIGSEQVWNRSKTSAGGGGVSTAFALPDYQAPNPDFGILPIINVDTKKTGRMVPDVAGCADPQSGYQVVVDGGSYVIGGTSAVAPLWAALAARVKALGGDLANIHSKLYAAGKQRDVTIGDNGAYKAGPGLDACTGLGSPDGARVLSILAPSAPPVTPTPPTDSVDRAKVTSIITASRAQADAIYAAALAQVKAL